MLDQYFQTRLQSYFVKFAKVLHKLSITANCLTTFGLALGLLGSLLISQEFYKSGIVVFLISRLCDGLDGALARLTAPTLFGAFWDIVADFIVYASVPVGFAWSNSPENALASVVLIFSFMGTASSFLALAALALPDADKKAIPKGFYYVNKGVEAGETLAFFTLMALFPQYFPILAYSFAILCLITTGMRVLFAKHQLS